MSSKYVFFYFLSLCALASGSLFAQDIQEFKSPDVSNKPISYWMFQNGNMTKEGITKDLEAMKVAGVSGTLFFSVGFFPAGPVQFMSQNWWDHLAHAIKESDRLKMKFGVYNSDGWSMSGGPWITPEESMKQIVWADTIVNGGRNVHLKLPQPRINSIYNDIAVVAFPALDNDRQIPNVKIIKSELVSNISFATDNQLSTNVLFLKAKDDNVANAVFDMGNTTRVRRIVFDKVLAQPFLDGMAIVEYSNDGKKYIKVEDSFPLNMKAEGLVKQFTLNFSQIQARYIRVGVSFEAETKKPVTLTQGSIGFGEIRFYQSPRINLWEPKSGQSKRIRHERQAILIDELNSDADEDLPVGYKINTNDQIDLTAKVDKDGVLRCDLPDGKWIIQRSGYTSTNRMVGPATKGGRGLECNKMDAKAVEKHFNAYTGKIIELSNKLLGRPIDYMMMESWEAGIQNWTEGFEKEFEKRNKYSLIPYLPVLAGGYVVNSYQESNKFLWDFRNVVSQLIAENYWRTMYRCAKEKGVTVSGEGSGMQHYLYDPMRYQQYLDIPMGEYWPNEGHVRADIKNASSVAHTYGRALAGGESFTSGDKKLWSVTPYDLKQIGDEAFTMGLNFMVLHTYVHQPYDVAPGFTLSKFGNHLQRLNPWYTKSQGWFNYLARCQYMLRQGRSIQDIAYFTGEGIPAYLGLPWELRPALPRGYDYDGVNTDIIKQMSVKEGKLYLPTGASYQMLVFQDISRMTSELVTEIKRLVADGATVVSAKPAGSPSLSGNSSAGLLVATIADEVWGNVDGVRVRERRYGNGKIYHGVPLEDILKNNLAPDFSYKSDENAEINFVHRQSGDTDIYFIANYQKNPVTVDASFRVKNKVPELWDPDKGTHMPLPYKISGDRIDVPLQFDPLGAMFIVFRDGKRIVGNNQAALKEDLRIPVKAPWKVSFKSASDSLTTVFDQLTDWAKNKDSRIKYFSGSASYSTDIQLNESFGSKIMLNLGQVNNNNMATVKVNGIKVADLWKPPYVADISEFVKNGKNHLEIVVTNTATNSLIGDERYPADLTYDTKASIAAIPKWLGHPEKRKSERRTFVTFKYITGEAKLDPSGMMGPVEITILK